MSSDSAHKSTKAVCATADPLVQEKAKKEYYKQKPVEGLQAFGLHSIPAQQW